MLYIFLLIASTIVLAFVLFSVIKNEMNIRYAMVWIIWAIMMIVISIFPEIISFFSKLIGIKIPSNMVFLLFVFVLYCLMFYVYLKLSSHNEDILNINYKISILEKRIENLEKKKERREK